MNSQINNNIKQFENEFMELNFEPHNEIDENTIQSRLSIKSDDLTENIETKEPAGIHDGLDLLEIQPKSMYKNEIDKNKSLYKLSFKLTNEQYVELIYNTTLNTFNATKFIKSLGDKTRKQFNDWLRYDDINKFINYVSHHLFLNQNPKLYSNEQEFKQKRIMYVLNDKATNIEKGTWLNFELLPEILRYSSNKYRYLANHYELILLPKLTLENKTFESEVKQLDEWYHSLYDDYINSFKEIEEEKMPVLKGSATEKLTMKLLNQVFNPYPEEFNNIEHIGQSEKHTCDLRIINEKILVEVKMVKSQPYHGNNKFIRDLKENASTTKAGIYINWGNGDIQTHIEQYPLRFYINRKDFNVPFLKIIQNSLINENNTKTIKEQIENEYNNQLAHNMEVSDKLIQNGTIFYTNVLKAILARMKLDPNIKPYVNVSDMENKEKMLETIQRGEGKEIFDEYVNEFITLNFDKFKVGYVTEDAKLDLLEYVLSKGIYFMTDTDMSTAFKSRLRLDRHSAPRKYKFMKGTENNYKQLDTSKIDTSKLTSYEEAVKKGMKTYEDTVKEFLSLPENQVKINNSKGFLTEKFNLEFNKYVKENINPESFGITYYRFMKYYYQYMIDHFIQITCKKKTKYIDSSSEKAVALIEEFDELVKSELNKNKSISYDKLILSYNQLKGNQEQLSKSITIPRFNKLYSTIVKK